MTPLYSDTGLQRLDRIIGPHLLCAFDFDGTLSPIVKQPDHAELPHSVQQRLIALLRLAPVAILSGRSVHDLRNRLEFEPDFMIGNHGMEGLPGWRRRANDYEAVCRRWVSGLPSVLRDIDPGIQLEDKGYSVSLHYRMARDPARAERELAALIDTVEPKARVITGKYVFNLVPAGAPDKGVALEQLMRDTGAAAAIYVGDDVTDEDVFRLQRPDVLGVRVEHSDRSAAEFFIAERRDIETLLDDLIARLQRVSKEGGPKGNRPRANKHEASA